MTPTHSSPAGDGAPRARRVSRPGWRDPRLVLGLALVAACTLIGARVLAGADDRVPVWAAESAIPAGADLSTAGLVRVRVAFEEGASGYFTATGDPPEGVTVHALAAGDLLARSAVAGTGTAADVVEVPFSVAVGDLPADTSRGDVVDVWVVPTGTGDPAAARVVLEAVSVLALPDGADSFAPRSSRQVVVGVPAGSRDDLAAALGALADGRVVLVRRPGS